MSSRLSLLAILFVLVFSKTVMRSLIKAVSCSLFGAINNLDELMNSSLIGILMIRGAWSEDK